MRNETVAAYSYGWLKNGLWLGDLGTSPVPQTVTCGVLRIAHVDECYDLQSSPGSTPTRCDNRRYDDQSRCIQRHESCSEFEARRVSNSVRDRPRHAYR